MKFYLISPPYEHEEFTIENLDFITDTLKVDYFQFRPKYNRIDQRIKFVDNYFYNISKICKKKKIKLIINNDFKIAKHFKFDGIHLGPNDKSCKDAKKEFGKEFIVGVSCMNSFSRYKLANNQNADYIAFGSVFKSATKKEAVGPENLILNKNIIQLPFTLIGGINHSNILSLSYLKPNNIALIGSIWNYQDGAKKSAVLYKKILKDFK